MRARSAVPQCARVGIAVRQCARIGMGFEGTSTVSLPHCLTRQKSDHRLNATPATQWRKIRWRKNQSHVGPSACHCLTPASSNLNRKRAANFSHILICELTRDICRAKFTLICDNLLIAKRHICMIGVWANHINLSIS